MIKEKLEELTEAVETELAAHEAELDKRAEEMKRLSEFVDALEWVLSTEMFEIAAQKEGISLHDWIKKTLFEAIDAPKLPIKRPIYDRFRRLASIRSQNLETLCKGQLFSDYLTRALDNQII